jgi:hypothetical protein
LYTKHAAHYHRLIKHALQRSSTQNIPVNVICLLFSMAQTPQHALIAKTGLAIRQLPLRTAWQQEALMYAAKHITACSALAHVQLPAAQGESAATAESQRD